MSGGERALPRWADWGAILVASLAAVALAVTVVVASAGLEGASNATVRGEGEALVARLHESEHGPPTRGELEAQLARFGPEGLRFVAFRDAGMGLSAGASTIPWEDVPAGALVVRGDRALLVSPLARPGMPGGAPGMPPPFEATSRARPPGVLPDRPPPPPGAPPGAPPPFAIEGPDAALVLEFAPSVLPRLREGMNRTIAVGSIAVLVLLSFALFLTTRAVRRGERERRAEQERRLVALGQMSSVMAHELRNPLASLKGNAQLLEEMLGDGTREHTKAALVVREAERLERLTADLLAFVRDGQLVRAAVTPASLVARATLGLPEGRVDVDLSRAPAIVQVDEARLAAALGNLVRNAVQSSPEGGRVRVRVTAGDAEGSVAIEVEDDGPGIAAGEEESIFEPFVTKRVHGTGLGLAVARRAVEQHGGTVRAVPRTGGALFRVVLPRGAGTG